MNIGTPRQYRSETYQEACEWYVAFRFDEPDEEQNRNFHAWLQEGPANVAAYFDVASTWITAGSKAVTDAYPRSRLISEAAAAADEVVFPIAVSGRRTHSSAASPCSKSPTNQRWHSRPAVRLAVAASLVLCIASVMLMIWGKEGSQAYSTGIGERHLIVLNDGSTVNLDSRSSVRVRYAARERRVELLQGQALFRVAKNPTRPFVVYSGATQVKAVGTEFDVYRKALGTVVTVIEGRVAVVTVIARAPSRAGGDAPAAVPAANVVSAGEQLIITTNEMPHLEDMNVSDAVSWAQGKLVFASAPLKDVADDFNRYNTRQIVIADPSLGEFEIDGVFSSTDVSDLVQFLRQRPEMEVIETGTQISIRRK